MKGAYAQKECYSLRNAFQSCPWSAEELLSRHTSVPERKKNNGLVVITWGKVRGVISEKSQKPSRVSKDHGGKFKSSLRWICQSF